jgi:ribosomal protection tetracycline resistance protein
VSRRTLNLGILAHVDAGKTTLTERLLYAAGVIAEPGSVDAGTTQTDSLTLERQRGITIKSAVAAFGLGGISVNLIDTPGHPDFIAEVERVLSVLDGAVLVISAVEGVQPQTRILFRTLQRLRLPTLLFVNKIDRAGADPGRVLAMIVDRLSPAIIAMGAARDLGSARAEFVASGETDDGFAGRLAESLADRDDGVLSAYLADDAGLPYQRLRAELAAQATRALLYPVFFGSAITGAGVSALMAGIAELLPAAAGDAEGPVSGRIFKIERGGSGEKIAYVRLFSGTVRTRDRLRLGSDAEAKVTAVAVFDRGPASPRPAVSAGEIAKIWGLAQAQIGDRVGNLDLDAARPEFPPPTLESVVVASDPAEGARLRVALGQIAEQDPLINVRQDDERKEIYVSLYGEVQKEVIQATLASDYGVEVTFREAPMICVERLAGTASALEVLQSDEHPYSATIGLRIEPGRPGSGVAFRLDFDPRRIPIYIYKTAGSFTEAMAQYVRDTLAQGLSGWEVTDCGVVMNECDYYIGDGPHKQVLPTPRTTAADFRKLTPLVLMAAVRQAGTVVCEPMARVHLELPPARLGAVLSALARIGASMELPASIAGQSVIEALLPSAQVHLVQQQLPGLTGGEGVLESSFGGYEPVRGSGPVRSASPASPAARR